MQGLMCVWVCGCVGVCMWQVDPAKDIEPGWANAEISEDVGPSDY